MSDLVTDIGRICEACGHSRPSQTFVNLYVSGMNLAHEARSGTREVELAANIMLNIHELRRVANYCTCPISYR